MSDAERFAIRFALDDLADVEPWGDGAAASLHWFGLTQGRFWIETPAGDILRYTPEAETHFRAQGPGAEYQVARLFEDVQDVLPAVREPVPVDIAARFADPDWDDRARSAIGEDDDVTGAEADLARRALAAWSARTVDTGYLRSGPFITFWRVGDRVHVRWANRGNVLGGVPLFVVPAGAATIPAPTFDRAVTAFLDGVVDAMADRIRRIEAGESARRPCRLDVAELRADHARRVAELRRVQGLMSAG